MSHQPVPLSTDGIHTATSSSVEEDEEAYLMKNMPESKSGAVFEQQEQDNSSIAIPVILGTEICERFSYYGLRAVLVIYLSAYLNFTEDQATAINHSFIVLCYLSPLVGGYLSDTYFGRYNTILSVSVVYWIGSIVLAVTAIPGVTGHPPHWWGVALGLLLVGMGTGGIKPCVSAFIGDQIPPGKVSVYIADPMITWPRPLLAIHTPIHTSQAQGWDR
eukprot:GFYU01028571.1.p1 GENE.GFYU01028571.1~~GFYU01028571.1.p1  ORF type:complete len:218 (-),score=24.87 GFYU01028571.1:89-742(-)